MRGRTPATSFARHTCERARSETQLCAISTMVCKMSACTGALFTHREWKPDGCSAVIACVKQHCSEHCSSSYASWNCCSARRQRFCPHLVVAGLCRVRRRDQAIACDRQTTHRLVDKLAASHREHTVNETTLPIDQSQNICSLTC